MAMEADYGMLLARTDFDVPKHAGISWFAFRLDQPGRRRSARCARSPATRCSTRCSSTTRSSTDADLIGGENNGWAVTQTTLMFERVGHRRRAAPWRLPAARARRAGSSSSGPATPPRAAPPAATSKVLTVDELFELARRTGATDDPLVRQKLARLVEYTSDGRVDGEARRWGRRPRAAAPASPTSASSPRRGSPSSSADDRASTSLGPDGLLWHPDGPRDGPLRRGARVLGRRRRSTAGPTRSSATSSASGRSASRGSPTRTRAPVPRRARPHEHASNRADQCRTEETTMGVVAAPTTCS